LADVGARAIVANMEATLSVQGVSRRFGPKTVLRALDFALPPGEILGLLGQNGAGKTTCLRIIAGDLAASVGRVLVGGDDIATAPIRAKRRIGYLPERPPIYPEMRVEEYLEYCARLHRIPPGAIARAVARCKRRCGLDDVSRRLIGKLSKGYRQRIGLAAALVHEPELVILDEPTDGLDPVQIREVRDLILELADRAAVVISTHALAEAQATCSRVIVLHDGAVLHDGRLDAPHELLLRLARPPRPAQLRALPVVASAVERHGAFQVRLAQDATAESLAEAVVRAGWGLHELTPARSDIERIFFGSIGAESAT
jgi:ABC-2 type transport system ATP-binding protein